MYEDKSAVKNIGEYDDYAPAETEEVDTEGLLSPFTFLCFAVILVLFGAVTLLSASYDTALRADTAFYSPFIKEIGALFHRPCNRECSLLCSSEVSEALSFSAASSLSCALFCCTVCKKLHAVISLYLDNGNDGDADSSLSFFRYRSPDFQP